MAYARCGDVAAALHWLAAAREARDTNLPNFVIDPAFDRIRTDPRFGEFWDSMPGLTAGLALPGPGYALRAGR